MEGDPEVRAAPEKQEAHRSHPTHHTTHQPSHGSGISPQQMPWVLVTVLLAVLLTVSLFMNYKLMTSVVSGGGPAAPAPTLTGPDAPDVPSAPVDMTLAADDHIRGSKDAKLIIYEYGDFECPFCGRAAPTVAQISSTYGKDVAIVYRHFPLSFHPSARPAALASECAGEQGKFWEYHDILFEHQTALAKSNLVDYAKQLKLDEKKFTSCLDSSKYADKVDADFASGQAAGVTGTPSFFINGKNLAGAYPFESFKPLIDAALA